jgi:CRP/FNR family transcriptional regulator, cyclic AMP receptor protein
MAELLNIEAVRQRLAALPIETYQAGDTVLAEGTTTGKVLVLKRGAVEVVKDGVKLGEVTAAGAVFGEISALLGEPHAADVRALQPTTFHVADAASFLGTDGTTALYVATIMARRLTGSNSALVEVKKQLESGQPRSAVRRLLDKIIEGYGPYGDTYSAYGIAPWY